MKTRWKKRGGFSLRKEDRERGGGRGREEERKRGRERLAHIFPQVPAIASPKAHGLC